MLGRYSQVISSHALAQVNKLNFDFFKYQIQFLDFDTSFLFRDGIVFEFPEESLEHFSHMIDTKAFFTDESSKLRDAIVQLL